MIVIIQCINHVVDLRVARFMRIQPLILAAIGGWGAVGSDDPFFPGMPAFYVWKIYSGAKASLAHPDSGLGKFGRTSEFVKGMFPTSLSVSKGIVRARKCHTNMASLGKCQTGVHQWSQLLPWLGHSGARRERERKRGGLCSHMTTSNGVVVIPDLPLAASESQAEMGAILLWRTGNCRRRESQCGDTVTTLHSCIHSAWYLIFFVLQIKWVPSWGRHQPWSSARLGAVGATREMNAEWW